MKLLLHTCCAPCSTYVINVLKKDYDICLFFYNPNLFPYKEFEKRYENAKIVCNKFGLELIVPEQNEKEFLDYVKGFEEEEEGGLLPAPSIISAIALLGAVALTRRRS